MTWKQIFEQLSYYTNKPKIYQLEYTKKHNFCSVTNKDTKELAIFLTSHQQESLQSKKVSNIIHRYKKKYLTLLTGTGYKVLSISYARISNETFNIGTKNNILQRLAQND